ncbi:MAG: hypothetical protein ACRC2V_04900, partial [Xenococcaceae cyanobacterium]
IQWRNEKIDRRNQKRQQRAELLNRADPSLQEKISFAQQFADRKYVSEKDLAYTTETDLIDQEIANKDKLDADWQKKLDSEH